MKDVKICIRGVLIGMEQALYLYCEEKSNDKIKSREMLKYQEGLSALRDMQLE